MDLSTLNPPQREAVLHHDGPLLVLAGAGSGKTRVITYRIASLIANGCAPSNVLAVTFTNKAAGEMRQRAAALIGGPANGLWIGTFHSICSRLLRTHGRAVGLNADFQIYDTADQRSLIIQTLRDLNLSERLFAPAEVLARIDRAKNEGIGPEGYQSSDFFGDAVAKVYPAYERRLLAAQAVDFGGLLLKVVELLKREPELAASLAQRFVHLLVDEFQDTNHVQYELVRLLSATHHNLCVVGDDDQSIYSWRGANVRNILEFERDHPGAKVVKLEQNYRSTQTILDAAGAVIARNDQRKPKQLWTEAGGGAPIDYNACSDERDEAAFVARTIGRLHHEQGIAYGDIAVFYRMHAQSRVLEEALRSQRPSIPHVVVGGVRFYDRAEVKDLLAYLRVLANPADDVAALRIINVPPRGIGDTTIEKVAAHGRNSGLTFLAAAEQCAAGQGEVSTIARSRLRAFVNLLSELREQGHRPSSEIAELVLELSGYSERLASDATMEADARAENLIELISSMRDYEQQAENPSLTGFLEHVALASEVDTFSEDEGAVALMTVHSAKGLEFRHVLIVGLEQGVFPHSRAVTDPEQMQEERRLAYVALTRAREQLHLTHALRRMLYGQQQVNAPSDFLLDVPRTLLTTPVVRRAALSFGTEYERDRRPDRGSDDVWVDYSYDQSAPLPPDVDDNPTFRVGMRVQHKTFGLGSIRMINGTPPNLNLTIYFEKLGPRTIRSQYIRPA